ncbi:MAG: adenylyl-sulfate reductase subunit beta [Kiloniellales bacterium]
MPTYVDPDKCDGCRALERPACMYICPMDLMALDPVLGKGFNQEPDLCWECYSCVKVCPNSAIDMRGYADVMPMGATLKPVRGTHTILWTVKYRDGRVKRFKLPIRTTQWGSIVPFPDDARPARIEVKSTALFGDDKYLGVDRLPVPGAT